MKSLLGWLFIISGLAIFVSLPIYIWSENVFYIKLFGTALIVCVFAFVIILFIGVHEERGKENAYDVLAKIEKMQREEDGKNGINKPKSRFMEKLEKLAKEKGYTLPKDK